MKNFFLKLMIVEFIALFLFQPQVVLAEIKEKDFWPKEKEVIARRENLSSFSFAQSSCFELAALSLIYLPKELKEELASECKKATKKTKKAKKKSLAKAGRKAKKSKKMSKSQGFGKSPFVFMTPYDSIYRRAEERFGVPWQILSVIHEVESGRAGNTFLRSPSGAVGPMQFLPSTFSIYGVDGNNDGRAEIYNVEDAIFSAANYLAAHGGRKKETLSYAIFSYNPSWWYVNLILYKAKMLGLVV